MFVVLLRFSTNKAEAGRFMDMHKDWIKRGFDDAVFLMVGSLQPNSGGAILAHNTSRGDLEARVRGDPFVEHHVVSAEILEIAPARTDGRLRFLA
jgi:uncharacterized protein YciI